MSRILVTGAYGNIGQFVVAELLRGGHHVVALDRKNPSTLLAEKKLAQPRISTVWGDIRDVGAVRAALDGVRAVVHMAAIIPPLSETEPELATAINVDATAQLIDAMKASASARRIVFASSMGIYGKKQERQRPLQVTDAPAPADWYGRTKVRAEELVRSSALDWTILRLTASPPVNLASARSHKGNNPFEFHPDARVELVHPADAGAAFARAVGCKESIGRTFFVGGGESCRMSHYELTCRSLGAAGLSSVDRSAFKDTGTIEMYGDWVETEEGQALLDYQHHTASDYFEEFKKSFGWSYYLVRSIAPLATWALVKKHGFR